MEAVHFSFALMEFMSGEDMSGDKEEHQQEQEGRRLRREASYLCRAATYATACVRLLQPPSRASPSSSLPLPLPLNCVFLHLWQQRGEGPHKHESVSRLQVCHVYNAMLCCVLLCYAVLCCVCCAVLICALVCVLCSGSSLPLPPRSYWHCCYYCEQYCLRSHLMCFFNLAPA